MPGAMRRPRRLWVVVVSIGSGCGGPAPSPPDPGPAAGCVPWFAESAEARGLRFVHRSGHRERFLMPEIMAGGAALVDLDGDGDLDAYLVQSGGNGQLPPNRLYRNRGDGTFEEITEGSGAGDRGYGMGVAAGDYDNDGDLDLYVTNVGPNVLLRNDGGGRFTDVTAIAGVGHEGFGSSAAFVDYDHDGDLDLFALNYLAWSVGTELACSNSLGMPDYCSPQNYDAPAFDVLYRNEGDGTFTDVTRAAGLEEAIGTGLGVLCGDFDADGWIDLFVANDGMEDHLWINRGDGTFRNEALFAGCAVDESGKTKAGMGVAAADVDDDGDLDLLVGNLADETDSFFRNDGGYFTDVTAVAGLGVTSRPFTRFGMAWLDFDNDGALDLYQVNGRVMLQADPPGEDPYAEPNLLFRGAAGSRFDEVRPRGGTRLPLVATSRAAAFGDIDGDGGLDVLVVNRDARAHLLRNVVPARGHWIAFRALDEHGRDALGATITLRAGDRTIRRDVRSAYSYLAANDPRVHVGLGPHETVTDVQVQWVDGTRESFGTFDAGAVVTLRRGG